MEKLAREEFSISCFPVSRWKRRIEDNIQICKSVFLNFLILLKLFPNFVSNVFDIKKSDRLESPWNETYSSRIFYLKLSKYRIYCLIYFKEIGKAVKRAGKRQWIGWYLSIVRIDRRNGIRSPDKNFLDNSLPSFRVFYVFPTTFCFTAISFIPRPRFLSKGSWNSWTEIRRGGKHLKH